MRPEELPHTLNGATIYDWAEMARRLKEQLAQALDDRARLQGETERLRNQGREAAGAVMDSNAYRLVAHLQEVEALLKESTDAMKQQALIHDDTHRHDEQELRLLDAVRLFLSLLKPPL